MLPSRAYNLLGLSDLHLGCDLRSTAPFGDTRRALLDTALVQFLDHHAVRREEGKRWRLLLAGDIFDFVAVTAMPGSLLTTPFDICAEERSIGLAPEAEKCVWKIRRIAARHEEVFHALARFLIAGHEVHFIRGNHDAEIQFLAVQQELVRLLARRAGVEGAERIALESRIEFHPWCYLEPGLLYVEHGNAHDRYCLQTGFFEDAPGVGAELELPMSSKVLRYFAIRWAKDQEDVDHADKMSVIQYVAWIFRMGSPLRIAIDFFALTLRVLRPIAWKALGRSLVERGGRRRADQAVDAKRVARVARWLARFSNGDADTKPQARAMLAAASRPAEHSLFAAAQLFYVDRILLSSAALVTMLWALLITRGAIGLVACAAALLAFVLGNSALARQRRCDAHMLLRAAAEQVARIWPVRYVVMGHSHHRVDATLAQGTRYLNLGSWSIDGGGLPFLLVVGSEAQVGSFEPRTAPTRRVGFEPNPDRKPSRSAPGLLGSC